MHYLSSLKILNEAISSKLEMPNLFCMRTQPVIYQKLCEYHRFSIFTVQRDSIHSLDTICLFTIAPEGNCNWLKNDSKPCYHYYYHHICINLLCKYAWRQCLPISDVGVTLGKAVKFNVKAAFEGFVKHISDPKTTGGLNNIVLPGSTGF